MTGKQLALQVDTMILGEDASPIETSEREAVHINVPLVTAKMNLGDLNSTAKGSGARANGGKPDHALLPILVMAESYLRVRPDSVYAEALRCLGMFQSTHEIGHLFQALEAVGQEWDSCAKVFEYGRKKYAAWNWAKGMPWSVPLACASRHLQKLLRGEPIDDESGESHEGHVYCNVVMLLTFAQTYPEGNDLPPVGLLG